MKKLICMILAAALMTLDAENMLNLLGIQADDCVQAIAAVCAVGLQADEVWLLQAKDAQALERLKTLAFSRMAAKLDETESYLPDQYVIVKKGVILTDGNYLAFLISPDVEALQTVFQDAMK